MLVIVLIKETASAPDEAAASAIGRKSLALGESFTMTGRVVTRRTAAVTSAPNRRIPLNDDTNARILQADGIQHTRRGLHRARMGVAPARKQRRPLADHCSQLLDSGYLLHSIAKWARCDHNWIM